MSSRFRPATNLSSWRRLALHIWGSPSDPTVYGNIDLNMRQALEYLDRAATVEVKPTVTHLVIRAIAEALAEVPEANGIIAGRRVYLRDSVDVYCQIATDQGKDLSGVKVTGADRKSVSTIAEELSDNVGRVRRHENIGSETTKRLLSRLPLPLIGPLTRATGFLTYGLRLDLGWLGVPFDQFGGAMVSNVGGFGAGHALAPLVPISRVPVVLLVGSITDRPAVEDGQVTVAPMMTLGCTFDHRMIDGYQASKMASVVTRCISDPVSALGQP